jgi:hypothetical protein
MKIWFAKNWLLVLAAGCMVFMVTFLYGIHNAVHKVALEPQPCETHQRLVLHNSYEIWPSYKPPRNEASSHVSLLLILLPL